MDGLLAKWVAACGVEGAAVRAAGEDLLRRWTEPHRRYHTVDHLAAVLSLVDGVAGKAVPLAAWFHDAVYDPHRADNEELSAVLAESVLGTLALDAAVIAEVGRLVRLTATHDPAPGDRNGALLCDADLAILGSPPDVYRRYAAAVRAEYAHVPDELFRAGRAAVLRTLLARPTLYQLSEYRIKWEQTARNNLTNEVSVLTRGPFSREPLDL